MEPGEVIFQAVCKAGDQISAVADLPAADLRELNGYLARLGELNGVPGKVWSIAIYQAAQRWLKGGQG